MASMHRWIDGLWHSAGTTRCRRALLMAAVAFAGCHILAVCFTPGQSNWGSVGPVQALVYGAAVIARLTLPLACLIASVLAKRAKH